MEYIENKEQFLLVVGSRIRAIRENKGMGQEHLAAILETSQAHLSKVENGLREPGIFWLNRLSKVLGVPPHFILDFEQEI